MLKKLLFVLVFLISTNAATVLAQVAGSGAYDIGSPVVEDVYVDPDSGNDGNSGSSRSDALRTVAEAWDRIPQGSTLSGNGYRINLLPGSYPEDTLPNYWEDRHGTATFPIIIQAADGQGTATLGGDINMYDVSYFYLINFNIIPDPAGDVFHCEQCDHILMRGMVMNGAGQGVRAAHETIKINQSRHIYIEESNIGGSYENAIDFVSVQRGHIIGNKIHDADDWCAYVKGGSALFLVEKNEFYNCGTGGFTAGQGTGFEYMVSPWLHYEAYDVKFVNNIIHDVEGAAFGVNGGYNILMAFNTAYRVGSRSHLIEFVFGGRSCDGDSASCTANRNAGGWGPPTAGADEQPIGNKNIFVYNNIIYNPAGYESQWQHLAVYGPRNADAGTNVPSPQRADVNLRIKGNIIWNGDSSKPLGIGDGGCNNGNPTCNEAQLLSDNAINTVEPDFINAADEDFRPVSGGVLEGLAAVSIPDFSGGDQVTTPLAPAGNLDNSVPDDLGGASRSNATARGAYASHTSSLGPVVPDGPGSGDGQGPSITIRVARARVVNGELRVRVRARIRGRVQSADLAVRSLEGSSLGQANLRHRRGTRIYQGRVRISPDPGLENVEIEVIAIDRDGDQASELRTLLVN